MSQYKVKQGDMFYVFGWDQPLQSYFLQVHDMTLSEDFRIVTWLGATSETAMYEVEQLTQAASKHGLTIPYRTEMDLFKDKDNGR